jgi:two-component sensor histidine kinase
MDVALNVKHAAGPKVMVLPPAAPPTSADEINHRIANSLQLLCAMVSFEARGIADPAAREALETTRRRIGAIAGIHRQLYQAQEATRVDLKAYLRELGRDLDPGAGGVRVRVRADSVIVAAEAATSIGIIVSELVTNACKYAYAPGTAGEVAILLRGTVAGGYLLEVSDRGRGRDPHARPDGTGLGGRLIEMMAARVGGKCAWADERPGTRFSLHVARG